MVVSYRDLGLHKRDMVKLKTDKPRGVLNRPVLGPNQHLRFEPSADLAPFVEHYWFVCWDVAEPRVAEVLSHPSVHLVLERGDSSVGGPALGRFERVITGKGRVLGTKFRPGGFRPFVDVPLTAFTDRKYPLKEVFGASCKGLESRALAHLDRDRLTDAIAAVEKFLRGRHPKPDPSIDLACRIAQRIATDRDMIKVDQIAHAFGLGKRQLQRLFSEYVGVTPKWVIQRYRLHEAAERVASSVAIDWSALALDLGYADQAHFIRDFKKTIGKSPAAYSKQLLIDAPISP
jgi:AraC-like DNA-binding protein